jgi:hypothetical protein
MRRLAVVGALALVLSLLAGSTRASDGVATDGCLVVQSGKGIASVNAKGTIVGHFDYGKVTITDPTPGDGTVKVTGADRVRLITEKKTLYSGTDVHFRASGKSVVRVEAIFTDLSAVGHGKVTLSADDYSDPGTFSMDDASFCQAGFRPVPDLQTSYVLGSSS